VLGESAGGMLTTGDVDVGAITAMDGTPSCALVSIVSSDTGGGGSLYMGGDTTGGCVSGAALLSTLTSDLAWTGWDGGELDGDKKEGIGGRIELEPSFTGVVGSDGGGLAATGGFGSVAKAPTADKFLECRFD
jgi:hypothetical protein